MNARLNVAKATSYLQREVVSTEWMAHQTDLRRYIHGGRLKDLGRLIAGLDAAGARCKQHQIDLALLAFPRISARIHGIFRWKLSLRKYNGL